MEEIGRRIRAAGPNPPAARAGDWCRFGDMLAKDLNMSAATCNNIALRKLVKEAGGVAAIWRHEFPREAEQLSYRYGAPSQNLRHNVHYVPYAVHPWTYPQFYQSATYPQSSSYPQSCPGMPATQSHNMPPKVSGAASDSHFNSDRDGNSSRTSDSDDDSGDEDRTVDDSVKPETMEQTAKKIDEQKPAGKRSSKPEAVEESNNKTEEQKPTEKELSSEPDSKKRCRRPVSLSSSDHSLPFIESEPSVRKGDKISDVWIIAGDDSLHPDFLKAIASEADKAGWVLDPIRLPSSLVLHTGVAISQILLAIDSDASALKSDYRLNCVVSEHCLRQWPQAHQPTHKCRIDNINHCLRAFGVDGAATKSLESNRGLHSSREHLLRSSLQSFMILGDGPVGTVNVPVYKERLAWLEKKALTDQSFLEELAFANLYSPDRAPNGIELWTAKGSEVNDMCRHIIEVSGLGANVMLLVLDPSGRALSPWNAL